MSTESRNSYTTPVFSKDNLPANPSEWKAYPKKNKTRLFRVEGPFEVITLEHDGINNPPFKCENGWLALDNNGNPYAINASEIEELYDLSKGE